MQSIDIVGKVEETIFKVQFSRIENAPSFFTIIPTALKNSMPLERLLVTIL